METKKDIRKHVLKLRSQLKQKEWEEKSRKIQDKVVTHPFFLCAETIYCYIDYRNEVATRSIIQKAWELHKKVAVPKVEGNELIFYYISSLSNLEIGYKGILEPCTNQNADDKDALIIVPGVAFDLNRNRIGYGKGFYDRYMAKHPGFKTIGIAFSCQIISQIEAEQFDCKPDVLITEEDVYESLTK